MSKKSHYERPKVETVGARKIVELMGPVSCGSSQVSLPVAGEIEFPGSSSGGNADLF